jgi:hypothetical protein
MLAMHINGSVLLKVVLSTIGGHRGHDSMVVGFETTCAISAYQQKTTCAISAYLQSCEFESCVLRGVLDTTLCDKVVYGF